MNKEIPKEPLTYQTPKEVLKFMNKISKKKERKVGPRVKNESNK